MNNLVADLIQQIQWFPWTVALIVQESTQHMKTPVTWKYLLEVQHLAARLQKYALSDAPDVEEQN